MSWAEVKKINSDLSTPLNELIENKMRYITSDNVISVIGTSTSISVTEKTLLEKKMKYPGVLSLRIYRPSVNAYAYVYKNGVKILTITAESNASYTEPFEFNKDDIIKVAVRSVTGNGNIPSVTILGMVAFGDF